MHINKINNKKYIGITGRKPEERWGNNGIHYINSPRFYSGIKKYGWDNFEHTILFENLTLEEACAKEIELIKEYKTQDKKYGYNILEGGTCAPMPEEYRKKISEALKGNKHCLGRPCSEETKKKIRDAQKGRPLTEEHKKKLSIAASKRHVPCSDEKRKQLSKSYPNKRKIYCYELDTTYESVHEAARQLNIAATLISKVCHKKTKSTGGYHFKYIDD